jgi:hypothetical protein
MDPVVGVVVPDGATAFSVYHSDVAAMIGLLTEIRDELQLLVKTVSPGHEEPLKRHRRGVSKSTVKTLHKILGDS